MRNVLKVLVATGVALAATQVSAATNLVQNGDFESGYTHNTEFNTWYNPESGPTGWVSQTYEAFNLYFSPATATTVSAETQYGSDRQMLAPSFVASPTGGNFVALDGDPTNHGYLTQQISGLTPGKEYVVSFDWGASQLQNRQGPTTEQLAVGFGNATQTTAIVANSSQGFSGWMHESFTFHAKSTSQVLSFLSNGTPVGLPPIAVLDGVSVAAVPEPAMWGLMLVGFGLVGTAVRRRRPSAVLA
ncbi:MULTISPECIES: PEPxxWA-CTERM sorting domain-containing protein [Sphingosinicellaceae]|uniref:PEPxxWA-CTERM sorting domain-containing protein n=1 Tax=Sphingosinicellaceae TaxID=2820280 RepID=UPI001D02B71B|nr:MULTISPECIES: PEPxxWA-CTERM sorting domain-containing protein [Polymorphobacter]